MPAVLKCPSQDNGICINLCTAVILNMTSIAASKKQAVLSACNKHYQCPLRLGLSENRRWCITCMLRFIFVNPIIYGYHFYFSGMSNSAANPLYELFKLYSPVVSSILNAFSSSVKLSTTPSHTLLPLNCLRLSHSNS